MTMTHDYTKSKLRWGWSYKVISGDETAFSAIGWGEGLRVGDEIKVSFSNGAEEQVYRIAEIKYKYDPQDMWEGSFTRIP